MKSPSFHFSRLPGSASAVEYWASGASGAIDAIENISDSTGTGASSGTIEEVAISAREDKLIILRA
jgi:hypothetical protein